MSDEFDPYLQWLGIREEQRPPTPSQLLGLKEGERDPQAIAAAAQATAAKVKLFLQSRHAPRAQVLLKEIQTARATLLAEAGYQAKPASQAGQPTGGRPAAQAKPQPRAKVASPPGAKSKSAPVAPPKAAAKPAARPAAGKQSTRKAPPPPPPAQAGSATGFEVVTEQGGAAGGGSVHLRQPRGGKKPWPLIVGGGIAAVLLLLVVGVFAFSPGDGDVADLGEEVPDEPLQMADPSPEDAPREPDDPREDPEGDIDWGDLPGGEIPGRPIDGPGEAQPLTPVEQGEGVIDSSIPAVWETGLPRGEPLERHPARAPGTQATINALRAAYAAIGDRNLEQAQRELVVARAGAQGSADKDEVLRLEMTLLLLTQFWDAVDQQVREIPPGATIRYGGSVYEGPLLTVVGRGEGTLQLRDANGWEEDFDIHPARIDPAVALGLAEQGLASSGGAGLAAQGAFLALDRDGDPTMAAVAWELASAQAWPVDQLAPMRRFDFSQLIAGAAAGPAAAEETDALAGGPPWPTPVGGDLLDARRQVSNLYEADIRQATTRAQKGEVAGRLLAAGRLAGTPAERYAYYLEAKRLATASADAEQLFAVMDVLAAEFEIDARRERLQALSELTNQQLTGGEAALIVAFLDEEIDRLTLREEFEEAISLADRGERFARGRGGADGAAISNRFKQQQRWLHRLEQEQGPANEARERLSRFPDDSTANETLGWYTCVFLGDWDRGLPALALSDDPELSRRAEMDMETPTDPRTRLDVGKEWHELANERFANDEAVKGVLLSRAAYWISAAVPDLPENLQQEAETLLAQINRAQGGSEAAPQGAILATLLGNRWEFVFEDNPEVNHPLATGFRYRWFEFSPDGTCRNDRFAGRWQLQGETVVVTYPEKPQWREVFGLTPQGLLVEHYDPADTFICRGWGAPIQ